MISTIADDRQTAAHLSDGRPRHRRFDTSPLIRSTRGLLQLAEHSAAVDRVGSWLIMKEPNSIEQPAALTDIPMLAEYES